MTEIEYYFKHGKNYREEKIKDLHRCHNYDRCGNYVINEEEEDFCYQCRYLLEKEGIKKGQTFLNDY